jgi:hypothetical protein
MATASWYVGFRGGGGGGVAGGGGGGTGFTAALTGGFGAVFRLLERLALAAARRAGAVRFAFERAGRAGRAPRAGLRAEVRDFATRRVFAIGSVTRTSVRAGPVWTVANRVVSGQDPSNR